MPADPRVHVGVACIVEQDEAVPLPAVSAVGGLPESDGVMKTSFPKKNKPGRKGVKASIPGPAMRRGKPATTISIDTTRPEYAAGYERGYLDGVDWAKNEERFFLEHLQTKRNAKDIKGLINKRLGG